MIIVNAEPQGYNPAAEELLNRLGEVRNGPYSRAELLQHVAVATAVLVRLHHQVDEEIIAAAPALRWIVSPTTGLDHIDLDAAQRHGVDVLSLKGHRHFLATIPATAEHTWALLLALARNLPQAVADVRKGEWDRDRHRGHDLRGQRLGILGLGRVGMQVASYGRAFGMEVGANDPYRSDWPEWVERVTTLDELLEWCTILTIHVPLNDNTVHLINRSRLLRLRPTCLLINTSRGAIIDEGALVEMLRTGRLRGAALDVIAGERDPVRRRANPILDWAREGNNLIVTPHIAGATVESMHRTEMYMAQRLVEAVATAERAEGGYPS